MKLEEYINESIYSYPTLYRGYNHEESRLCVLGHTFLAYGTGLDWNHDGYLGSLHEEKDGLASLPEGFYDMDLWYIDCPEDRIDELDKELGDAFHYYKSGYDYGNRCCIFSSPEEKALEITKIFAKDKIPPEFRSEGYNRSPNEASSFFRQNKDNDTGLARLNETYYMDGYSPYPMCHYSPIVEMVNKRTNSSHIENFDLVDLRPDWIQGALDISRYCLEWYKNEDNHKYNHYYPDGKPNKFYDEDPEKYRADCDGTYGGVIFTAEMTIEEYTWASWEHFLAEQIGWFEKLIEMYG